jgi:hypothetical protein
LYLKDPFFDARSFGLLLNFAQLPLLCRQQFTTISASTEMMQWCHNITCFDGRIRYKHSAVLHPGAMPSLADVHHGARSDAPRSGGDTADAHPGGSTGVPSKVQVYSFGGESYKPYMYHNSIQAVDLTREFGDNVDWFDDDDGSDDMLTLHPRLITAGYVFFGGVIVVGVAILWREFQADRARSSKYGHSI